MSKNLKGLTLSEMIVIIDIKNDYEIEKEINNRLNEMEKEQKTLRIEKAKENNNFKGLTANEINYLIAMNEIIEISTSEGDYDIEWLLPNKPIDNEIIKNLPEEVETTQTEEYDNLPF